MIDKESLGSKLFSIGILMIIVSTLIIVITQNKAFFPSFIAGVFIATFAVLLIFYDGLREKYKKWRAKK